MKKVLSLVLAAAMVMGMSVSAFAASYSAPASGTGAKVDARTISWGNAILVNEDGYYDETVVPEDEESKLKVDFENLTEGDTIYFEIKTGASKETVTKEHEHDEDCVLFEMELVKQLAPFVDLGWDGDITVGEFVEFVEEAATNAEVKNAIKAVIEELGMTEISKYLNYGVIVGAALEALEADLYNYCDVEETVVVETESGNLNQKVPSNWVLKIENSEYIKDAELVRASAKVAKDAHLEEGAVYAKVVLNDDFKAMDEEEAGEVLKFYMYIWDTTNKVASDYAKVHFAFAEYKTVYVVDPDGKYAAEIDGDDYVNAERVIAAREDVYYKLKGLNSATVVFELDNSVYVTAKMWKGDSYMIKSDVDAEFSKELSKEYDEEIEVLTIDSNLDIREVLWESKKDNKQVVEVVDGYLYAVESEYVTKYEVIDGVVLAKGYIAETEEGSYALIDADIELIAAPEAEVEADKANPSTGASDFVGAAVAMAVVSVAAAGALALKK